jgi:ABC-2 type transport system ATP-binding protein
MTIQINNLNKRFGQTQALADVNLCFGDQKIYGLLGNNGAGKTTLFNIISNRYFADSGEVTLDGQPIPNNERALSRIHMLSEKNYYPEDMTVKDALYWAARFYPNFDKAFANEWADRFQLPIKKKITALSTGYETIFKIVIAFSTNVPFLLLDEPVLGLDAGHRDMFYKLLIARYSENPCTIIVSTHLIAEVAGLIEHCVIIKNGRIIKDAPCEDVLNNGYSVSGPASLVDGYLQQGKDVMYSSHLGSLKTASVSGTAPAASDKPNGLEFGKLNLQEYFIHLMNDASTVNKLNKGRQS